MVKKGRPLDQLDEHHKATIYCPNQKRFKKTTWICTICNKEYYFRSAAELCEKKHKPKVA